MEQENSIFHFDSSLSYTLYNNPTRFVDIHVQLTEVFALCVLQNQFLSEFVNKTVLHKCKISAELGHIHNFLCFYLTSLFMMNLHQQLLI